MIYKRNCPKCGDEIEYKNPRSFKPKLFQLLAGL